ncbi:hypothetical protein ACGFIE_13765 [Micromonospora sp. NPDC049275]|uniref:hypothetical protein n=1 Tax=unclassified Micromonospora TaxID=2617518 RepID=UPI003426C44F
MLPKIREPGGDIDRHRYFHIWTPFSGTVLVMPIQPNAPFHQNPTRLWRAAEATGPLPAQPRYRVTRTTGELSWAKLNKLPAGSSSRHGLNTR